MQKQILTTFFLLLAGTLFSFAQNDTIKKETDYRPQVEGLAKVIFEGSLYKGDVRFSVRNSRLGVRGNVADNMSYRIQIEYSNDGKFAPLDIFVAYRMRAVTFSLGQQQYSFSADLGRNPMQNIFSNRTLLTELITTYADTTGAVRSLGSRDIGGLLTLDLQKWLPLRLKVGAFSGSGTNTAVWRNRVNVSTKIEYGKRRGLQLAASGYIGQTPYNQNIRMFGGELRYVGKQFSIDSELARRTYEQVDSHTLTAAFVQGFYRFDLPQNSFAKYAAPTLRYDYLKGGIHGSAPKPFDAQRASVGVNFGVRQKMFEGEIRLNFEKYILAQSPAAISTGQLLHDKLVLEMVIAF